MTLRDEEAARLHEASLRIFAAVLAEQDDPVLKIAARELKSQADLMRFAGMRLEDLNEENVSA
jgi:hypothetical protein